MSGCFLNENGDDDGDFDLEQSLGITRRSHSTFRTKSPIKRKTNKSQEKNLPNKKKLKKQVYNDYENDFPSDSSSDSVYKGKKDDEFIPQEKIRKHRACFWKEKQRRNKINRYRKSKHILHILRNIKLLSTHLSKPIHEIISPEEHFILEEEHWKNDPFLSNILLRYNMWRFLHFIKCQSFCETNTFSSPESPLSFLSTFFLDSNLYDFFHIFIYNPSEFASFILPMDEDKRPIVLSLFLCLYYIFTIRFVIPIIAVTTSTHSFLVSSFSQKLSGRVAIKRNNKIFYTKQRSIKCFMDSFRSELNEDKLQEIVNTFGRCLLQMNTVFLTCPKIGPTHPLLRSFPSQSQGLMMEGLFSRQESIGDEQLMEALEKENTDDLAPVMEEEKKNRYHEQLNRCGDRGNTIMPYAEWLKKRAHEISNNLAGYQCAMPCRSPEETREFDEINRMSEHNHEEENSCMSQHNYEFLDVEPDCNFFQLNEFPHDGSNIVSISTLRLGVIPRSITNSENFLIFDDVNSIRSSCISLSDREALDDDAKIEEHLEYLPWTPNESEDTRGGPHITPMRFYEIEQEKCAHHYQNHLIELATRQIVTGELEQERELKNYKEPLNNNEERKSLNNVEIKHSLRISRLSTERRNSCQTDGLPSLNPVSTPIENNISPSLLIDKSALVLTNAINEQTEALASSSLPVPTCPRRVSLRIRRREAEEMKEPNVQLPSDAEDHLSTNHMIGTEKQVGFEMQRGADDINSSLRSSGSCSFAPSEDELIVKGIDPTDQEHEKSSLLLSKFKNQYNHGSHEAEEKQLLPYHIVPHIPKLYPMGNCNSTVSSDSEYEEFLSYSKDSSPAVQQASNYISNTYKALNTLTRRKIRRFALALHHQLSPSPHVESTPPLFNALLNTSSDRAAVHDSPFSSYWSDITQEEPFEVEPVQDKDTSFNSLTRDYINYLYSGTMLTLSDRNEMIECSRTYEPGRARRKWFRKVLESDNLFIATMQSVGSLWMSLLDGYLRLRSLGVDATTTNSKTELQELEKIPESEFLSLYLGIWKVNYEKEFSSGKRLLSIIDSLVEENRNSDGQIGLFGAFIAFYRMLLCGEVSTMLKQDKDTKQPLSDYCEEQCHYIEAQWDGMNDSSFDLEMTTQLERGSDIYLAMKYYYLLECDNLDICLSHPLVQVLDKWHQFQYLSTTPRESITQFNLPAAEWLSKRNISYNIIKGSLFSPVFHLDQSPVIDVSLHHGMRTILSSGQFGTRCDAQGNFYFSVSDSFLKLNQRNPLLLMMEKIRYLPPNYSPLIAEWKATRDMPTVFMHKAEDEATIPFHSILTSQRSIGLSQAGLAGGGIFALEDIPVGAVIVEYIGWMVQKEHVHLLEKIYRERNSSSTYFFALGEKFTSNQIANTNYNYTIDACIYSNNGRWINHSCDANCETLCIIDKNGRRHIIIVSIKNIRAGEEITYDYQLGHDTNAESYEKCYCGSYNCKKFM